jgi:hypothetical protein
MVTPSPEPGLSLLLIECGMTAIAIAVAFALPRLGGKAFAILERFFGRLARRKGLAVATVGLSAFLLRIAILPLCPIPHPFLPDDFSFLLAANTFAAGRLTNVTPAMWVHFETIHVTMKPTYMSMYFPAQGLVLAAGKVVAGNAWFGTLCMSALMCAGICWMLQAWLPPTWALLGGLIAILRLGLFSYWINTYSGGGAIAALGGALVLGALPRLMKTTRARDGVWMAIGVVLLATTRPYEGLLLCLPVSIKLGHWIFAGANKPAARVLMWRAALPVVLILAAGAGLARYDARAFGNPFTLPYTVDRATYAMAPYFVWQSARPEPVYRHAVMRRFYYRNELVEFSKIHNRYRFVPKTLSKAFGGLLFFSGFALLPPLLMLRRVFLDRRLRFLVICVVVLMAGMLIQIFMLPHYLAPFTAAFYAIGLQAMRHLRVWRPGGQPVGAGLVRSLVTLCFVLGCMRLYAAPLHLSLIEWPPSEWIGVWYGPGPFGRERAAVKAELERKPGKQLVITRYSVNHDPFDEWVYNAPDIDASKVIWAREMDAAENCELIHYYKDRKVWLVQPDLRPTPVTPYPTECQGNSPSGANHRMMTTAVRGQASEVKP